MAVSDTVTIEHNLEQREVVLSEGISSDLSDSSRYVAPEERYVNQFATDRSDGHGQSCSCII